jgi:hypothetical protein
MILCVYPTGTVDLITIIASDVYSLADSMTDSIDDVLK